MTARQHNTVLIRMVRDSRRRRGLLARRNHTSAASASGSVIGSEQLCPRHTKAAASLTEVRFGSRRVMRRQRMGAGCVKHDRGCVRKFARCGEQSICVRALARHDDLRAGQLEIERVEQ